MTVSDLSEFIARQLNDHEDCDHGVRQGTYTTWKEPHIVQAIEHALSYVYTLVPDRFTKVVTYTTPSASCILDASGVCTKVVDLLSVGDDCDNVNIEREETNDLLALLSPSCPSSTEDEKQQFTLKRKTGSIYVSGSEIPANTKITVLCASSPDVATVSNEILLEFQPLISSLALWWLLLTDNESRSNEARWKDYYIMAKDFVETKLLLEFSLQEDDYNFGRRKVND